MVEISTPPLSLDLPPLRTKARSESKAGGADKQYPALEVPGHRLSATPNRLTWGYPSAHHPHAETPPLLTRGAP